MSKIFTKDQIIERFNKVHDNKYNYSQFTTYVSQKLSIVILCPIHGEFTRNIQKHLQGQGCPKCAGRGKNTEDVIKEFQQLHGDKYDYSKVLYVNPYKHVTIICKDHGEFKQTYHQHMNKLTKFHCPNCKSENYALDEITVIERFNKIHGDKYDYSKVEKVQSIQHDVEIICKDHDSFLQRIDNHFSGKGCYKCSAKQSTIEKEVFDFVLQFDKNIKKDKTLLKGLEIDILSEKYKLGIEINGLYYHRNDKKRHLTKTELTEKEGYQLIHIYEDDWLFKASIVKSRLANLFKQNEKIFARKTLIKVMFSFEAKEFFETNHIQGNANCAYYYGLFYENQCVAAMSFSKRSILGNDEIELVRYASKKNINVIGGASKLLKHFIKTYQPKEIISFADRSWSTGNLYKQLGFTLLHATKPNYYYVHERKRQPRYRFQKHKLVEQGFDPLKTEREIMLQRGFYMVYDSGSLKFKLSVKS